MMTDFEKIFVDTNVLLYSSIDKLGFKDIADEFLATHDNLVTSYQVIIEFFNNCTNGKIIKAVSKFEVISKIKDILSFIDLINDSFWKIDDFEKCINDLEILGRRVFDLRIYLAMKSSNIRKIATNNENDFHIFKDLEVINPFKRSNQ